MRSNQHFTNLGVFEVTFSNGEVWHIPLVHIARHRAHQLVPLSFGGRWTPDNLDESASKLSDEIKFGLDHPLELADWAFNNMNWSDVSSAAQLVSANTIDREEEWPNVTYKVIQDEELLRDQLGDQLKD